MRSGIRAWSLCGRTRSPSLRWPARLRSARGSDGVASLGRQASQRVSFACFELCVKLYLGAVVSDTLGFSAVYVAVEAVASKAAVRGRAAASNCVIGRRPRINSIVRRTEDWLYMLLSTIPRCV